jgi:hypothetical protein
MCLNLCAFASLREFFSVSSLVLGSNDELLQKFAGLPQSGLPALQRIFVGAIFDLYADWPAIPNIRQRGEELIPLNVTESGKLGDMPTKA